MNGVERYALRLRGVCRSVPLFSEFEGVAVAGFAVYAGAYSRTAQRRSSLSSFRVDAVWECCFRRQDSINRRQCASQAKRYGGVFSARTEMARGE